MVSIAFLTAERVGALMAWNSGATLRALALYRRTAESLLLQQGCEGCVRPAARGSGLRTRRSMG